MAGSKPCTLRRRRAATGVTSALFGLFKSDEEKRLEAYSRSSHGSLLNVKLDGVGSDRGRLLSLGSEALGSMESARDVRLIDTSVRVLIATVLNRLIDIPILNEMQEQVIALKVVDVVSDALEKELHRMPQVQSFFAELRVSDPAKQRQWRDALVEKINRAIDLPLLNEDQEAVAITFIVDLVINHVTKPYK